jgi:hypothetical protein
LPTGGQYSHYAEHDAGAVKNQVLLGRHVFNDAAAAAGNVLIYQQDGRDIAGKKDHQNGTGIEAFNSAGGNEKNNCDQDFCNRQCQGNEAGHGPYQRGRNEFFFEHFKIHEFVSARVKEEYDKKEGDAVGDNSVHNVQISCVSMRYNDGVLIYKKTGVLPVAWSDLFYQINLDCVSEKYKSVLEMDDLI